MSRRTNEELADIFTRLEGDHYNAQLTQVERDALSQVSARLRANDGYGYDVALEALEKIREICRLATMGNWRCEEIDKIVRAATLILDNLKEPENG